jgi:predicted metal-binding membrane protein
MTIAGLAPGCDDPLHGRERSTAVVTAGSDAAPAAPTPPGLTASTRRRLATAVVLSVLAVFAWIASIRQMNGTGMDSRFSVGTFGFFIGLWVVMMAAMMFPSVWPTVALYGTIARNRAAVGVRAGFASTTFVIAYLASWATYGVLAFGVLELASHSRLGDLSDEQLARYVVAPVALAAAIYELVPLKQACLRHCRSPFSFLLAHWRGGATGALQMGAIHGAYCVGCCWMLMLVLLALGMMSITWMAVVSVAIAVEKLAPRKFGRAASTVLTAGLLVLAVVALVRPSALPGVGGMNDMNDKAPAMTSDSMNGTPVSAASSDMGTGDQQIGGTTTTMK